MLVATRVVRSGNRLGTEGFHQPGKKIGIMAIDVLTHMREAIGGARMKELGAWLGVNQSALSDRIRRNTMPTRRLRLFEAGTVTIHLGS